MSRNYFLKTERIGFSRWEPTDAALAKSLWGDPRVTRFICAGGIFSDNDILERLKLEIAQEQTSRVQYWPIFELTSGELIGCCGLRPRAGTEYEIGFHLRPAFWGRGYAGEAARAVIHDAFTARGVSALFAGHHPENAASRKLLKSLGFVYIGDQFYGPTGLYHPSYELKNPMDCP